MLQLASATALDFLSGTNVVCLQKPFRPPHLMRAIEAAQGSVQGSVKGSVQPSTSAVAAAAR